MLCHFCGVETGAFVNHRNQQGCQHALEKALKRLRRTLLEERHGRFLGRRRFREAPVRAGALRARA